VCNDDVLYIKQVDVATKNIAKYKGMCVESEMQACAIRGISTERFILLMAASDTPFNALLHTLISPKTSDELTRYCYDLFSRLIGTELHDTITVFVKHTTPKQLLNFKLRHAWRLSNCKTIPIIIESYKNGSDLLSPFVVSEV
jgi:uncharacterized protein YqkB